MPGTPPTSPRLGIPRFASGDPATYWTQTNSVVDRIDTVVPALDDARFTDQRTPADGSVTDAKVAAAAAIAESKLNLADDAAPGTGSRRTLGAGAQQAAAGNDSRLSDARVPTAHAASHQPGGSDDIGLPPIGAIVAYAGVALPSPLASGGKWDWADGGLIDKTTYATFFGIVAHTYNGGVDPGSNKVKKPDKRGRVSVGAVSYGAGSGGAAPGRAQAVIGTGAGAATVALTGTQLAVHTHSTTLANHAHATTATTPDHVHGPSVVGSEGGASRQTVNAIPITNNAGEPLAWGNHTHTINLTNTGGSGALGCTMSNPNPSSLPAMASGAGTTNGAAGAGHENMPPYESDNYLVRIA